jgi:hypothetical protein
VCSVSFPAHIDHRIQSLGGDIMRVCCWCRTVIQKEPGSYYCEVMGRLFLDYPWQCLRGDMPKGGDNQKVKTRQGKIASDKNAGRG